MASYDLLNEVQPSGGWYAIVGIHKDKPLRQKLFETREEADAEIASLLSEQFNVFFGVAKYGSGASRTQDNVDAIKSLWLDVDCGPSKDYPDQAAAMKALRAFCADAALPTPTVVNSGYGLHVYWPFTHAVEPEDWNTAAAGLKALCAKHGLRVDASVFETARILRVPGTFNFKREDPAPVEVLIQGTPTDFYTLKDKFPTNTLGPPPKESFLMKKLAAADKNKEASYARIMERGVRGCKQLLLAYRDRETLPYERWFDALSVANSCEVDGYEAAHKLSRGHPDYSPEALDRKLENAGKPHYCKTFEDHYPQGCVGCPNKGKINSPIALGMELKISAKDDELEDTDPETGESYPAPEYPWPYVRGATGGIYLLPEGNTGGKKGKAAGPEEEEEPDDDIKGPELIYRNDLYPVRRMRDAEGAGGMVIYRHHTVRDKVIEFVLTHRQLTDANEFRKLMSDNEVLIQSGKWAKLQRMLISAVAKLQDGKDADLMKNQFGWHNHDASFIIGDREIRADGVFHSPPTKMTRGFASLMQPVGEYDEWKKVFNLFGLAGMEPQQFAALAGFASPIFKYTGQDGLIISLVSESSGSGKTSVLKGINSVYGHPKLLLNVQRDTQNSKDAIMGLFQNIPITIDEITNIKTEVFSEQVYGITQGRGKHRMEGGSNALRVNDTHWALLGVTSSNQSMYEKLNVGKYEPDGELMRVMEYKLKPNAILDQDHARHMFDEVLPLNYGHAGSEYADYVIRNLAYVKHRMFALRSLIDDTLKLTSRERIWSAGFTSISLAHELITGKGIVTQDATAGLWDRARLHNFMSWLLGDLRAQAPEPVTKDPGIVLGEYLNNNVQHIMVIDGGADRRIHSERVKPLVEPRDKLHVRWEPDTGLLRMSIPPFRQWCVDNQINYRDFLERIRNNKSLIKENVAIRLGTGSKYVSAPTKGLVIEYKTLSPDDIAAMRESETEDAR
jgi:hypothetical protein